MSLPLGALRSDAAVRRRLAGAYEVDPWGLDQELVRLVSPLVGLRWGVEAQGADRLPAEGPAVLLYNRRYGLSEPFVVARGVRLATGRFVRTVGIPDVAPVGPALRRLGGVLDRADEVAGLLRAGEVVALPLGRDRRAHRAGAVDPRTVVAARGAGVPVLPVALVGSELGRGWHLSVGEPVPEPGGFGPLADDDYAVACRHAVQQLLDVAFPRRSVPDPALAAR